MTEKRYVEDIKKCAEVMIENLPDKKCSNCGAELPTYPNYEYDRLDSRGYSEVWICPKCKKNHKRGDFDD